MVTAPGADGNSTRIGVKLNTPVAASEGRTETAAPATTQYRSMSMVNDVTRVSCFIVIPPSHSMKMMGTLVGATGLCPGQSCEPRGPTVTNSSLLPIGVQLR